METIVSAVITGAVAIIVCLLNSHHQATTTRNLIEYKLSELTKRETGLPVFTGPIEGTALGNLMAQFIKDGEFASLLEARNHIYTSFEIKEI